jgi:hypothetical protein
MKKNFSFSRTYLYLLLFVIVAAGASLSLVRIIDGFEGQFESSTAELIHSFEND